MMKTIELDKLKPNPDWYKLTNNQRELRRYRLTSPIFLQLLDSLEPGFREMLHALTKDIYDGFWEIDREVENWIDEYDVTSARDMYAYCFIKMDVGWEGLPKEFVDFVWDHL